MALTDLFTGNAATSQQTSPVTVAILAALATIFVTFIASVAIRPSIPSGAPKLSANNWPIVGSLGFFNRRWDFFKEAVNASKTGNFSYYVGKHQVIGLSGEKARKFFFDSRDLNFSEGYSVLFAAGPSAGEDKGDEAMQGGFGPFFSKRLITLLKTEPLKRRLPLLLKDTRQGLEELAASPSNITKPYDSMYGVIFALTMRIVGADEIADDREELSKCLRFYEMIEDAATPAKIIFPWLPTPASMKRNYAGFRIYMMFKKLADKRKAEGRRIDDPFQYLLDQGDSIINIISFVMGALFAGLLNSGINAAAVLSYLASNPEWQDKVYTEVKAIAANYAKDTSAPIWDQLDTVPLEAWESQFPMVDYCLKESIRLNALGTAFRRNTTRKTLQIPGSDEVVPPGSFVTYHLSDIHHNPKIYRDPMGFDPARYLEGRQEDKSETYAWSGWGQSRHPCLGMRFAKLEQNILIAYCLAQYEWTNCDVNGSPKEGIPPVDINGHSAQKPKADWYIKFTQRK